MQHDCLQQYLSNKLILFLHRIKSLKNTRKVDRFNDKPKNEKVEQKQGFRNESH